MAKYLLSVHSSDEATAEAATDEEMRESWARIQEIEDDMRSAGAWFFSGKLYDADTATVVRAAAGGDVLTTDGPFVESKEHIAGFYIVEAGDLDAALGWAARVTAAIGKPIEVRPFSATAGG